jgi:hypothetical protein
MTKDEQKQIVRELCDRVKVETLARIKAGEIPETWGGREFRWYIADQIGCLHAEQRFHSYTAEHLKINAQVREYRNDRAGMPF